MGSNGARGGGASGSDAGFANTQKSKLTKTNQEIVDSNFRDRGANKIKKGIKTPSIAINVLGTVLSKPLQAGSKINRDFYTNKVLGSKNYKNQSKKDFLSMSVTAQENQFKDYISSRNAGTIDAFGNPIGGFGSGSGSNNSAMIKKNIGGKIVSVSPTTAEISQATATEADTTSIDNIETRKKKAKAKGRSMTILSSSRGVTSDENLILGKKSLLGA